CRRFAKASPRCFTSAPTHTPVTTHLRAVSSPSNPAWPSTGKYSGAASRSASPRASTRAKSPKGRIPSRLPTTSWLFTTAWQHARAMEEPPPNCSQSPTWDSAPSLPA
ncbi:MAG: hypothetical protein AVDCRST_MAG83-456, partial [uncultured Arthrobacter sp.]